MTDPIPRRTTAEINAAYAAALLRVLSFTWAGILSLAAAAGFLINALTAENLTQEVQNIIALGLRADLALLGAFLVGSLVVVMIVTSGNVKTNESESSDSITKFVASFIAGGSTVFSLHLLSVFFTTVRPLWAAVEKLIS